MTVLTAPFLKARWFWCSILAASCWGGWALLSKLATLEIPETSTQFLSNLGMLPVAVTVITARAFRFEKSGRGISYSLAGGGLSAAGIVALLAAFRSGGSTSVITVTTALYPMITVVLAVLILRERLTRLQMVGLGLAAVAMVIFSL